MRKAKMAYDKEMTSTELDALRTQLVEFELYMWQGEGEEWAVKREMETINYLMQEQSGMCIYCKKKELNVKGELDELSCFKWLHRCQ